MSDAPDKNCITLPDGSCIGTNCMHDPGYKPFIGNDVLNQPIYTQDQLDAALAQARAEGCDEGTFLEREACAKIVELNAHRIPDCEGHIKMIAAAIRAREGTR